MHAAQASRFKIHVSWHIMMSKCTKHISKVTSVLVCPIWVHVLHLFFWKCSATSFLFSCCLFRDYADTAQSLCCHLISKTPGLTGQACWHVDLGVEPLVGQQFWHSVQSFDSESVVGVGKKIDHCHSSLCQADLLRYKTNACPTRFTLPPNTPPASHAVGQIHPASCVGWCIPLQDQRGLLQGVDQVSRWGGGPYERQDIVFLFIITDLKNSFKHFNILNKQKKGQRENGD